MVFLPAGAEESGGLDDKSDEGVGPVSLWILEICGRWKNALTYMVIYDHSYTVYQPDPICYSGLSKQLCCCHRVDPGHVGDILSVLVWVSLVCGDRGFWAFLLRLLPLKWRDGSICATYSIFVIHQLLTWYICNSLTCCMRKIRKKKHPVTDPLSSICTWYLDIRVSDGHRIWLWASAGDSRNRNISILTTNIRRNGLKEG